MLIDGRGGLQRNVLVVVRGNRIERIAPGSTAGLTVHARPVRDSPCSPASSTRTSTSTRTSAPTVARSNQGETPAQRAYAAAQNAYVTLMAGFTTVQSIGSPTDTATQRDAIERGDCQARASSRR